MAADPPPAPTPAAAPGAGIAEELRAALAAADPGEHVELYASEHHELTVTADAAGRPDRIARSTERGVAVRLFAAGRVGFAYCSQPARAAVASAVTEARLNARYATGDSDAPPTPATSTAGQARRAEPPGAASTREALAVLDAQATAALGVPGVRSLSRCECGTRTSTRLLLDSAGTELVDTAVQSWAVVTALAGPAGAGASGTEGALSGELGGLDGEALGRTAGGEAATLLHPLPCSGAAMPVVLGPHATATLLAEIVRGFNARTVRAGRSMVAELLDEQVGPAHLHLTDDGALPGGPRTRDWDGEGQPTARTALVRGGRVSGLLHDTATARWAATRSTGNSHRASTRRPPTVAASNVTLGDTGHHPAEVLRAAGEGLLCHRFVAAHSALDLVSGHLNVTAVGRRIRGGMAAEPLRQVRLTGTLPGILAGIRQVGTDGRFLPWSDGVEGRTVLLDGCTVAG